VDFRDVLTRRRSVRTYADRSVPRDVLERIANAAVVWAPSAGYSQGLRLVVVTDAEQRRLVATAASGGQRPPDARPSWAEVAPVHVVVLTREEDYHERYRQPDKLDEDGGEIEWPVPYWHVDAGKAAMLILLAAIDEGLAAGVFGVGGEGMTRVRDILGLPDDVALVEIITLGRPAADDPSDRLSSRGTRPRKPLDELVRWERWDSS
jgi:FMN reductase [NAD(P)H]